MSNIFEIYDMDTSSESEDFFEVDEKDMQAVINLDAQLDENPNNYDAHVQVSCTSYSTLAFVRLNSHWEVLLCSCSC